MTEMAYNVSLNTPYDESLERVISALKEEGFGGRINNEFGN